MQYSRIASSSIILSVLIVAPVKGAYGSSPTSHILISEKAINEVAKNPDINPELREILHDLDAREAFSGGACAPDLDSVSDDSHATDPKGTADKLMQKAREHLARAEEGLKKASTESQREAAVAAVRSAKCDIAFAYGWRTHAAADFNTHPAVNATWDNYWEESSAKQKALHAEWEVMQELNWVRKYGNPVNAAPSMRLALLQEALDLDYDKLSEDEQKLFKNSAAAKDLRSQYAAEKEGAASLQDVVKHALFEYSDEQENEWSGINSAIGDRSIELSLSFLKDPAKLDDSCWDLGYGISLVDFQLFITDVKAENNGALPEGFWVTYEETFAKWKQAREEPSEAEVRNQKKEPIKTQPSEASTDPVIETTVEEKPEPASKPKTTARVHTEKEQEQIDYLRKQIASQHDWMRLYLRRIAWIMKRAQETLDSLRDILKKEQTRIADQRREADAFMARSQEAMAATEDEKMKRFYQEQIALTKKFLAEETYTESYYMRPRTGPTYDQIKSHKARIAAAQKLAAEIQVSVDAGTCSDFSPIIIYRETGKTILDYRKAYQDIIKRLEKLDVELEKYYEPVPDYPKEPEYEPLKIHEQLQPEAPAESNHNL